PLSGMNQCRSALAGVFVAFCVVSANGALPLTWQVSNPPPTNRELDAVTFGNGQFAAVGKAILTSPNGMDWTLRAGGTSESYHLHGVAFGNGIFFAGGQEFTLTRWSPDGINWENGQGTSGIERFNGVAFGNGRFVAVGHGHDVATAFIISGSNGTDWQSVSPPTANELQGVAYGNGLFVAVGK